MKLTLAAVAMIAGAATVFAADDVVVPAQKTSPPLSLDQKATNACFSAFVAEMLPGSTARVRTVNPADGADIFTSVGASLLAPYQVMEVEMTANSVHGNELLAKSVCTVNRNAKVLRVSTHVTDAAKLAGLTLKDIKLAMTNR